MKLSKLMHVISVIVGFIGMYTFVAALNVGSNGLVFGITKADSLQCTMILFLIAIWSQVGAMHHMKLEKNGEWL